MDASFAREVANQLPLAEAVLRMFDQITQPDFLDPVFEKSFSTGMAVAMGAVEDGESGEQPLVPNVLAQTRAAFPNVSRLHVADRQYCDLIQMKRFTADGDHFLLRWNRKLS